MLSQASLEHNLSDYHALGWVDLGENIGSKVSNSSLWHTRESQQVKPRAASTMCLLNELSCRRVLE